METNSKPQLAARSACPALGSSLHPAIVRELARNPALPTLKRQRNTAGTVQDKENESVARTLVSAAEEPLVRDSTPEEAAAKRRKLTEPTSVEDVGDMDALRLLAHYTTIPSIPVDARDAATEPPESVADTSIRNVSIASARVGCSSSATIASPAVERSAEPLIREATMEEAVAKRKQLAEPERVEEVGDMDKLLRSKQARTEQSTVGSHTVDLLCDSCGEKVCLPWCAGPTSVSGRQGARETFPDALRNKSASAAEERTQATRFRGVGDQPTLREQERETRKQNAAGTQEYFGASVAAKLRKQLAVSSNTTGLAAAKREEDSEESARRTAVSSTAASSSMQAQLSGVLKEVPETVWLCFPCMQKRGEKSNRIDNDVEQRRCTDCGACPQGIYRLCEPPSPPHSAHSASNPNISSWPREPMGKRRAYAPTLAPQRVSANLDKYFRMQANEPVSISALEAGAGGDCLFHSIAAILEKLYLKHRVD